jgi:hypothetical protein
LDKNLCKFEQIFVVVVVKKLKLKIEYIFKNQFNKLLCITACCKKQKDIDTVENGQSDLADLEIELLLSSTHFSRDEIEDHFRKFRV